ncbi:hypothetical protein DFH09DRAFT_1100200 [Mycena vulgaris]|nr:hypothetical protein DFH09DRAFT_1100200 [Mycena vulgaris]
MPNSVRCTLHCESLEDEEEDDDEFTASIAVHLPGPHLRSLSITHDGWSSPSYLRHLADHLTLPQLEGLEICRVIPPFRIQPPHGPRPPPRMCALRTFSMLQGTFVDEEILPFEHIPTLTELPLTSQTVGIATTAGITCEPSVPCLLRDLKIDGELSANEFVRMVESQMNARLTGVACLEVLAVNTPGLEPVFNSRLLPMQARGLDLTPGERGPIVLGGSVGGCFGCFKTTFRTGLRAGDKLAVEGTGH